MLYCLPGKFYGPLFYSRHDSVVLTIMKGRDFGLPDYNTARREMGLKPVTSWEDINPWLNITHPEVNTMSIVSKSWAFGSCHGTHYNNNLEVPDVTI